jgi:hypothetical protein
MLVLLRVRGKRVMEAISSTSSSSTSRLLLVAVAVVVGLVVLLGLMLWVSIHCAVDHASLLTLATSGRVLVTSSRQ